MTDKLLNNQLKSNTYRSAIYQVIVMLSSFALYPLLFDFLDPVSLGIWLTLMSITSWFIICDFGVGNGVRNKIAPLVEQKEYTQTRVHLSSAYFYIFIFLLFFFFISIMIMGVGDYYSLFNIEYKSEPDLVLAIMILIFTTLMNLFFTINYSLSNALQNSSFAKYRQAIFNVLILLVLFLMVNYSSGTLLRMSYLYFTIHGLVNMFTTYRLYSLNRKFIPSYKLISWKSFKGNLNTGSQFFIVNLTSVILFSSDTLLISYLLGVTKVGSYVITMKALMIFLLFKWVYIGPLWSAYTVQYSQGNHLWIKNKLKESIVVSLAIILAMACFSIFFSDILSVWMGSTKLYNPTLLISICCLVGLRIWSSNFSTLLNGLGLVKIQMYCSILAMFLNIPLSIYFVRYLKFDVEGIVYGTVISLLIFAIIGPVYTYFKMKNSM
jgi:O-antigen/teichoic acid export membrane protein